MQRVYVSDTNIWIDFRNADLLDVLFRLPFRFCSTDFVLHELQDLAHEELTRRKLGPVSLKERISTLGGSLAIDTAPGRTCLEVLLPTGGAR